ncbi:MAG: DUF481 domain-containing protein [Proteobacteria bacterium]|nr:DUF481 domain-containing protein [Pseudomonadota bacterium]
MKTLLFILLVSITSVTFAAEPKLGWGHESEASAVIASGNANNQTYSLSQATDYLWPDDAIKTKARYLLGKTSGTETARNWALGARYERSLSTALSAYLGYQIDSNIFANLDYRHTGDLGAKYTWLSVKEHTVFSELGYRVTRENQLNPTLELTSHFLRAYTEWVANWTAVVSSKAYVEYLPNLTRSADWQLNSEVSLGTKLSDVFSLKTGYLFLYRNTPAGVGKKQLDTVFSTAVVAKF